MAGNEHRSEDAARRAFAEFLSANGGRVYPLLANQQRTWFLYQLDHRAPTAILRAYQLSGPLDVAILQQAAAELGWRYELLRSTFHELGGRGVRVVAGTAADLPLTVVDGGPAGWRSHLDELAARELGQPFDLAQGPLARLTVIRRETDAQLLVSMHEIIADEWVPDLLCQALFDSYQALCAAGEPEFQADDIAAIARAEHGWLAEAEASASLEFWRRALDEAPVLRLPTDRPRPVVKTRRCGNRYRTLPGGLVRQLESLAARSGTQLSTVVQAAFHALLARYARQADIVVGLRIRSEPGIFGAYANTLAIRVQTAPEMTFGTLLAQVHDADSAALRHARLPFSQVVEALDPVRDLSRTPLCQVLFSAREPFGARQVGELTISPLELEVSASPCDLSLTLLSGPRGTSLSLAYNEDLFNGSTAERHLAHLQTLLAAAARSDAALAVAPLASEAEIALITGEWNDTARPCPDQPLHELIRAQASRTPAAVAVSDQDQDLRYHELEERANQLAHHLLAAGTGPESRVAICLRRSVQMTVAILAVLKTGAAYLPLDPRYPGERLAYLLADSGSQLLLAQTSTLDRLPSSRPRTILIDAERDAIDRHPRLAPGVRVAPDALAYLIYTSGSTGRPKGVMVTHRGVVNNLTWRQRVWPLRPGERVLQNHPFSFDPSVWATFWPLTVGAECVISPQGPQFDSGEMVRLIRDRRIALYGAVPSVNSVLMEDPAIGECTSLRYVLSGAEALTSRLQQDIFQRLSATVANLYGPTETTIDATFWQCPRTAEPQDAPIGRPVDNSRIYLLDLDGQLVPPGVAGEICVAGAGLARGYHRRPGMTAGKFLPDPFSAVPGGRLYRTGDIGRWLEDGTIEWLGRADDQVKVRGFRVELAEIESVLRMSARVKEAAVVVRADTEGDNRLIGYVTAADPARPPADAELAAFVSDVLPPYMVPSAWVRLDALPLTVNGKVDRNALPSSAAAKASPAAESAPRTALEREVAQPFAAVLGMADVGAHDDFFELGGTSLMLARLALHLQKRYQLQIPVHQFFRVATVAGIASVVDTYNREGIAGVMSQQHAIRLDEDARLDDDIDGTGLPSGDLFNPRAVLLTGATGYLGSFILQQLLLRTRAQVYCLVRAQSEEAALRRIENSMRQYLIWSDVFRSRITAVPGDLSLPRLGLGEEAWGSLARQVDVIYHNGAMVNFVYPYSALRSANVCGTREVIRLACTSKVKAVHYISTIDVLLATHSPRPFLEDDTPLRNPVEVPGGYTGSKWVAEKIVYLARERGVPVSIYRPGLIMSHTATGATQTSDYLLVAFRGYLPMGILPDYPRIFDTVPVDYVAAAIVGISCQDSTAGPFFHLFNPAPVSIREFCEWIRSYGYEFDIVPFEEARRRALEVDSGHVLYPLVPLIRDAVADPQRSLDPAFIADLRPEQECANTVAALAGTGITCPPMSEEMAHSCLEYLVSVGFLPPVTDPRVAIAKEGS